MIAKLYRSRLHYGWIVVAITFITLLTAAGMRSTPGVLIVPLEEEFGWDRATISLAVSINLFVYGFSGPFIAGLIERFGIRRVMIISLLLVTAAASTTTIMQTPWQLYLLWGIIVGGATGALTPVLSAIVVNRWFVERRGIVMGLLTASNASGQLVFLPLLATLAVTFGWRSAAFTTAAAALVITPIILLFMRNRPHDVGLNAYGAKDEENEQVKPVANPVAAAIGGLMMGLRSPNFWLLAGSFFICGASTNGLIGTHLIPASMDHGIPEVTAAGMLATIGVFDLIGTTISGWLSDRLDNRWLLWWYYGLRGLSLLALPYVLGTSWIGLALFIVFYGLDWVATVPPTVRLAADLFGKQNVGIVFGWIMAAHQLGAATAAFGAGLLHNLSGSYQITFISSGLLCLVASGMVIFISRPGQKIVTPEITPSADISSVSSS